MADIPGWAYIIIGGVISGFSKFVETKSGSNLKLFFYIGIIFMVIGVGKMIFYATFGKKRRHEPFRQQNPTLTHTHTRAQRPAPAQNQMYTGQQSPVYRNDMHGRTHQYPPEQHHTHRYQPPQQAQQRTPQHVEEVKENNTPSASQHPSIITCPACGVKHYDYANFCMMCGRQMKR